VRDELTAAGRTSEPARRPMWPAPGAVTYVRPMHTTDNPTATIMKALSCIFNQGSCPGSLPLRAQPPNTRTRAQSVSNSALRPALREAAHVYCASPTSPRANCHALHSTLSHRPVQRVTHTRQCRCNSDTQYTCGTCTGLLRPTLAMEGASCEHAWGYPHSPTDARDVRGLMGSRT
jgi:hypothetical protein